MSEHYILGGEDGHTPIAVSLLEWADYIEKGAGNRRVAEDKLPNGKWVSSVFLGLDHSFGGSRPVLFETMIFTDAENLSEEYGRRSCTWTGCLIEHDVAMMLGLGVLNEDDIDAVDSQ